MYPMPLCVSKKTSNRKAAFNKFFKIKQNVTSEISQYFCQRNAENL
jgi:hypothetical protein